VLLADRYAADWLLLALLQELGVDFVVRQHPLCEANFHRGCRLGPGDHCVAWPKPLKPDGMGQMTYDRLPEQLEVCDVEVRVTVPGFRTESLVVVTALHDAREIPRDDLAALYRRRWSVEPHLRAIQSTMPLDVLRCQTPAMVRLELWTGLLACKLIRETKLQSARDAYRNAPTFLKRNDGWRGFVCSNSKLLSANARASAGNWR